MQRRGKTINKVSPSGYAHLAKQMKRFTKDFLKGPMEPQQVIDFIMESNFCWNPKSIKFWRRLAFKILAHFSIWDICELIGAMVDVLPKDGQIQTGRKFHINQIIEGFSDILIDSSAKWFEDHPEVVLVNTPPEMDSLEKSSLADNPLWKTYLHRGHGLLLTRGYD